MCIEEFRWKHGIYNITALRNDIESGYLCPIPIDLGVEFISNYCRLYLDMSSCEPRPPIEVNYAYAEAMTVEDLTEPIVLLHVGENEGIVTLREDESEVHYVVSGRKSLFSKKLGMPALRGGADRRVISVRPGHYSSRIPFYALVYAIDIYCGQVDSWPIHPTLGNCVRRHVFVVQVLSILRGHCALGLRPPGDGYFALVPPWRHSV